MKTCFLCRYCIPEWKEAISARKTTLSVRKGREVFRQGEPVKGIFFIYDGSVKVHTDWNDEKELILRFAKTGDILGHRGIGSSTLYPVGATALEDTKVCFIPDAFLDATLKTDPAFTLRLMHFYADELQKAEKRMRDLAHMEARGRIALALLEMEALFGIDREKYIGLPVSRQDLASYAGTTYETVFKFFTILLQTNVISIKGKRIRIRQPGKLKQFTRTAPVKKKPATGDN